MYVFVRMLFFLPLSLPPSPLLPSPLPSAPQAQIADHDGIVDADSSHPDYPHHVFCLHLLLKCLSIFFGWSSLSDRLYTGSLKQSLVNVVSRISSSQLGSASLPILAK